jgi:hypothetical protein
LDLKLAILAAEMPPMSPDPVFEAMIEAARRFPVVLEGILAWLMNGGNRGAAQVNFRVAIRYR